MGSSIFKCFFGGISYIQGIISSISILYFLKDLNMIYTMLLLILAVIQFVISYRLQNNSYEVNQSLETKRRQSGNFASMLFNVAYSKEIKLFASFPYIKNEWILRDSELEKNDLMLSQKFNRALIITILSKAALLLALMISYLINIKKGTVHQGTFVAAVMGLSSLVEFVLNNIQGGLMYIKGSAYSYDSYMEFLKLSEDINKICDFRLNKINHEIKFENVWFKYSNSNDYVLKNINFSFKIGKSISIVGKNGCGKTTMVNLMVGFYRPTKGKIFYDGIDADTIPEKERMKLFAAVMQNFVKYQMSVGDNITSGNPEYFGDNSKLLNKYYIDKLGVEQIISKLKDGYTTYLGTIKAGAVNLSGGEWQRVAIARALFSQRDILVLDEPTSALDPVTESDLYSIISKIAIGKTLFLISHRLGSTKITDTIILIEDGIIAEYGNHSELMNRNGKYAQMYNMQASWYKEDLEK